MTDQTIRLAHDFAVDAIEYASRANAILGIRDSGKTWTATLIAEQMFDAGIPFFAFDPIGRWRFLKVPGVGKDGRGFPETGRSVAGRDQRPQIARALPSSLAAEEDRLMARLPRPNVPTAIELAVVLRQRGYSPADIKFFVADAKRRRRLGIERDGSLFVLACTLGCPVKSLDLDHDPALENREKLVEMPDGRRRRVVIAPKGAVVLRYFPDANDPECLFYRPRGQEHGGSHKIKTLVRGDHGQHSDLALNNKLKRIAKNRDTKRRKVKIARPKNFKWPSRPFRRKA